MATIYSQAYVTISADDAKDTRDRFLGPRGEAANTSIKISCLLAPDRSGGASYNYTRRTWLDVGESNSTFQLFSEVVLEVVHTGEQKHIPSSLDSRGWTF